LTVSDDTLKARRLASHLEHLERVGRASEGARSVDFPGGVRAAMTPVRPDRSVVNAVAYSDTDALISVLDEVARVYEEAGIEAWTVWVPVEDRRAAEALAAAGHALDGIPRNMGAPLDEMDLEARFELDLDPDPDWVDVAELNESAYFASQGGRYFGPALARLDELPYVIRVDGRTAACLAIADIDDDAYVQLVATRPDFQRRGLAGELLRLALREARERGMKTTTLEGTAAGAPVYTRVGYRDLGELQMWERRVRNDSA
jgi:ribosomal protein S18 acetylase RimI-like enzyme